MKSTNSWGTPEEFLKLQRKKFHDLFISRSNEKNGASNDIDRASAMLFLVSFN